MTTTTIATVTTTTTTIKVQIYESEEKKYKNTRNVEFSPTKGRVCTDNQVSNNNIICGGIQI